MNNLVRKDFFDVVDTFFGPFALSPIQQLKGTIVNDIMKVDIKDETDKFVLLADLPGVQKENVKVDVDNGVLTISVQQLSENNITKEHYHHRERSSSYSARSFKFGDSVNLAEIKAAYKNGVLILDIPKNQKSIEKKTISIE